MAELRTTRRTFGALLVCLSVSLTGGTARCAPSSPSPSTLAQDDVGRSVAAIRSLAERLDGEIDAAPDPDPALVRKAIRSWTLSGLFDGSTPRYLEVMHVLGRAVREETYYFDQGRVMLARVHQWWDVDDDADAPAPPMVRDFFISGEMTIRRVVRIESSSPRTATDDTPVSAAQLIERARTFAAALRASGSIEATLDDLEEFPSETDPPGAQKP